MVVLSTNREPPSHPSQPRLSSEAVSYLKGASGAWNLKRKCLNFEKNLGRYSVITEVEICPDH